MSSQKAVPVKSLPAFHNEPTIDFSVPENRRKMEQALADVRSQLGREYDIVIAGERFKTGQKLESKNPSRPSEVVGVFHKATAELANKAVESAYAFFPEWSRTPAEKRVETLLNVASIMRARKLELDSWLVYEAGKTWPEADADVSEAIDFCEYYAREAVRLANPPKMHQLPGEHDEVFYIPLGVGIVIPPWNFPLAILAGMTVASLVTGNTVVIKPSSDTPTIAAKFAEILKEAGFPEKSFSLLVGSGAVVGDVVVGHPKTRFISFTGSKAVGLHINELAAKTAPGQIWIKRVVAEMGGKDAIVVDREADVDAAVAGVLASAFGYQGQKCSACSRAIVHEDVYDEFLAKLAPKVEALKVGITDDPGNFMGPVINAGAKKSIMEYIEIGKKEGRLVAGGSAADGDGYFIRPTVIADIDRKARIFQEEIFGPVLAVTKAKSFEEAIEMANNTEYGLTGAVYSKNPNKLEKARQEFHAGNLYLNRKCTGAMVGAHPFGGFNMSGTDSKAGGPDYLLLFTQMKSVATKLE